MASSYETRLGNAPEEGIKAPVAVATTGAITLSGEQTIGSVAVVEGDRVLVRAQADATEHGIYDVRVSAWVRAKDWNNADDVISGVLVTDENDGTIYQAFFDGTWEAGVTPVVFSAVEKVTGELIILDTVLELRNQNPVLSEWVEVRGHTVVGDAPGTRKYKWNASSTVTDDAGGTIKYALLDTGRWEVQSVGYVSPDWWGGATGIADADAWQAAIDWGETAGDKELVLGGKTYKIEKTVTIPVGWWKRGLNPDATVIKTATGANYYDEDGNLTTTALGGFAFWENIDPTGDVTTWIEQFPNTRSAGWRDMTWDGTDSSGGYFVNFAGSYQFHNIRMINIHKAFRKPSTVYCDNMVIENCHHTDSRPDTTTYLADLQGFGDGLKVDYFACGRYVDGGGKETTNGLNITFCRGGSVSNLINGNHRFYRSGDALTIQHGHMEGGSIELDGADCTVANMLFWVTADNVAEGKWGVILKNDHGGAIARRLPTVVDNEFIYMGNFRGGFPATLVPDIDFADGSTYAVLRNNVRTLGINGIGAHKQKTAAMIGLAGTVIDDWKNYAHVLNQQNLIVSGDNVEINGVAQELTFTTGFGSSGGISEDFSNRGWTFQGATDTYYYTYQIITDPVRLIGRAPTTGTTEEVVAAINGGNIISTYITKADGEQNSGVIIRMYRGTATGVYTNYVDVLATQNTWKLYDDGDTLNGYRWQTRTGGAVDTLNGSRFTGGHRYTNGYYEGMTTQSLGVPNRGVWKQGDIIRRRDITPPGTGNTVAVETVRVTNGSGHVNGTDWFNHVWEQQ